VAADRRVRAVNLSVWETIEQLDDFVFKTGHTPYLRRRRVWFQRLGEAFTMRERRPVSH
jgi:Domain of unknown function (DUF3291)